MFAALGVDAHGPRGFPQSLDTVQVERSNCDRRDNLSRRFARFATSPRCDRTRAPFDTDPVAMTATAEDADEAERKDTDETTVAEEAEGTGRTVEATAVAALAAAVTAVAMAVVAAAAAVAAVAVLAAADADADTDPTTAWCRSKGKRGQRR